MKTRTLVLVAALLTLAACDKKEETNPGANGTASGPVATAPSEQPVTIAEADLATPADFEESAESSITKANYKEELTKLEKDIEAP